jgi:hypothetical protein
MFLTVHALAGTLIGQAANQPWLGFGLGIVSHFLLDLIPHGDEHLIKDKNLVTKKEIGKMVLLAAVDGLIMLILLFTLIKIRIISLTLTILAGIIGSIIPDFFNGILILLDQKYFKKAIAFHYNLHFLTGKSVSLKVGLLIQAVFILSFIFILIIIK